MKCRTCDTRRVCGRSERPVRIGKTKMQRGREADTFEREKSDGGFQRLAGGHTAQQF